MNVPTPGVSTKVIEFPSAVPDDVHDPAIKYVFTELIKISVVEKRVLLAKLVAFEVVGATFPTVRPMVERRKSVPPEILRACTLTIIINFAVDEPDVTTTVFVAKMAAFDVRPITLGPRPPANRLRVGPVGPAVPVGPNDPVTPVNPV